MNRPSHLSINFAPTCLNRVAISNSSVKNLGQKLGTPVEPEDTAMIPQCSMRAPRQRATRE
jgi:hypothetical protein